MNAGLVARGIHYARGDRKILRNIDAAVTPGKITAILGPNGAGKSTLIKILAGELSPAHGSVEFDGKPLAQWPADEMARRRALLPQSPELAFHYMAGDVVAMGRYPHRGHTSKAQDQQAVEDCLAITETTPFAARDCRALSGGECHRVHYARVLAQLWRENGDSSRILLLDEPVAGLDLFHQHTLLARAKTMAAHGVGVMAVLHDLNLAYSYADEVLVLAGGTIESAGTPRDVLTPECIARIWRIQCEILHLANGRTVLGFV